jgi:hypothetical protein
MRCNFDPSTHEEGDISLEGQLVYRKDTFRYLGSMLYINMDINEDINQRIRAGWMKVTSSI